MSARILIVDDLLPSAKVLAAKLASEYYDVVMAHDGPEALTRVAEDRPDLILLDVMMPGMDGFEVCRRLKEDPKTAHIPVVIVTALGDREDRVAGLEAGADEFLTKPVDDVTLFARVRSLVRLKNMLDQWRLREETGQRLGLVTDGTPGVDSGRAARLALVGEGRLDGAYIADVLAEDDDRLDLLDDLDGAERRLAENDYDVAIVAFGENAENALRFASLLRSLEPTRQLPVLVIGDDTDRELLIKALEIGVNDYLLRPIDDEELKARVRTQVRRKRYQDRLRSTFMRQLSLALTDPVTGLHNRRYLDTHLENLLARMADSGKHVSLLMVDIDHFKKVNDSYGHAVGDEVLAAVAERVLRNVRGFDLTARYGGEEFVIAMPDTDLEVAVQVSERLRERMEAETITCADGKVDVCITLSIGVAEALNRGETSRSLLKRADEALYEAKRQGRNRVVVAAA